MATIVTNDKGIARIDDLPLGRYYLVETKTIDGFVLDDTPIEADLSYIDQNTKVVFAGMDVTNERQKVQITVTKTDSETKKALEGAVFGLFAVPWGQPPCHWWRCPSAPRARSFRCCSSLACISSFRKPLPLCYSGFLKRE